MKIEKMKSLMALLMVETAVNLFAWTHDGENPWSLQPRNVPATLSHVFAKPVSGKAPRILFLSIGIGLRSAAELAQRTEIEYELWPYYRCDVFSPFSSKKRIYAPVLSEADYKNETAKMFSDSKLAAFDGFIFGKAEIGAMPEKLRNKILVRVEAGAQLILILPEGSPQPAIPGASFSVRKIEFPVEKIPPLEGAVVRHAKFGKGGIFTISYRPEPTATKYFKTYGHHYPVESVAPFLCDDELWYDYCHAFVGKIILEAFHPDRAQFASLGRDGVFKLTRTLEKDAVVRYEFVDRFNNILYSGKVAPDTSAVPIPKTLPESTRMLNAFLCDASGKVVDYAVVPLSANAESSIAELKSDSDVYAPDKPVALSMKIAGRPNGCLIIELIDNFGRMIARKSVKAAPSVKTNLEFPFSGSRFARVLVRLTDGQRILDEKRIEIFFRETESFLDDFRFILWGSSVGKQRIWSEMLKYYSVLGVDAIYDFHSQYNNAGIVEALKNAQRSGMWFSVCLTSISNLHKHQERCNFSGWELYRKSKSFTDPSGTPWNSQLRGILKGMPLLRDRYGVLFYSLGDEPVVGKQDQCYCPECLPRFREYLRWIYGSIDKLNAAYGSKFKSFDEVTGMPLDRAAEKDLAPMWIDYRLFMEEQFINWHRLCIELIRKYDPKAKIGAEGFVYPARSYSGYNFYKLFPNFSFAGFYPNERDHVAAKYLQDKSVVSAIMGAAEGLMNSKHVQNRTWFCLFEGMNSIFWWKSEDLSNAFSNSASLGLLMQPLSHFKVCLDEVVKIRNSGQGRLITNSKKRNDRILIHYSNNCLHAETIMPDRSTWDSSLSDFGGLLRSLGLSFDYLSPGELEAGVPKDARVLILPYSQAMSDREIASVAAFVRNGGLLLTDHNPAIMNEHGGMRDSSPLLPIFGKFKRITVNRFGKGCAVYFGDYLAGADARSKKNEAGGIQEAFLKILKKYAGIRPFADVRDRFEHIQQVRVYECGKEKYLCMLGPVMEESAGRTSAAGAEGGVVAVTVGGSAGRKIRLEKSMFVYDLGRNGKFLGKTAEFEIDLAPSVGRIIVCSEKKYDKPLITVSSLSVEAGNKIILHINGFENTAVLTVRNPDGKAVLEKRIVGKKASFVPAWNDLPGKYKATIRNVSNGLENHIEFNVIIPERR
ncbi:MAG: Beta-galactosidase BgaA [Lentisphaerae bacterium ADurb.Bin242]|nr:MAG: Beta-galactosidase BgaA [Lentisphaerae bacterium ADurb.Bin242]